MSIKQLVYISRSVNLMKSDDLIALLEQARSRNHVLDITGMLLYKDCSFIQLLEGAEEAVNDVFTSILSDHRHTDIKKIVDTPVSERSFSQWSMGFHHLDEEPIALPEAYTDFMSSPTHIPNAQIATQATQLLSYFKQAS